MTEKITRIVRNPEKAFSVFFISGLPHNIERIRYAFFSKGIPSGAKGFLGKHGWQKERFWRQPTDAWHQDELVAIAVEDLVTEKLGLSCELVVGTSDILKKNFPFTWPTDEQEPIERPKNIRPIPAFENSWRPETPSQQDGLDYDSSVTEELDKKSPVNSDELHSVAIKTRKKLSNTKPLLDELQTSANTKTNPDIGEVLRERQKDHGFSDDFNQSTSNHHSEKSPTGSIRTKPRIQNALIPFLLASILIVMLVIAYQIVQQRYVVSINEDYNTPSPSSSSHNRTLSNDDQNEKASQFHSTTISDNNTKPIRLETTNNEAQPAKQPLQVASLAIPAPHNEARVVSADNSTRLTPAQPSNRNVGNITEFFDSMVTEKRSDRSNTNRQVDCELDIGRKCADPIDKKALIEEFF